MAVTSSENSGEDEEEEAWARRPDDPNAARNSSVGKAPACAGRRRFGGRDESVACPGPGSGRVSHSAQTPPDKAGDATKLRVCVSSLVQPTACSAYTAYIGTPRKAPIALESMPSGKP